MQTRVESLGRALELPAEKPPLEEIRRVVTIFRELRSGLTSDGKVKIKAPCSTLSTAEAISVLNQGLSLAAHFGDGQLRAADVASGLVGAVIKDPVQDRMVWLEYLETVMKERGAWKDLYRACKEKLPNKYGRNRQPVFLFGIRHHGPGSARSLMAALEHAAARSAAGGRSAGCRRHPPPGDRPSHAARRWRCWSMRPKTPVTARIFPLPNISPEWQAMRMGCCNSIPVRMMDLPQANQMATEP